MTIVIAGSTGLVGSAITRALIGRGQSVIGINRKVVDLLDRKATFEFINAAKPDLVIDTDTTPLHKKPKKAKKSILKDSSIITYTGKLRAFHLRMTGLPLSQDIINAIQGNDYDKKIVQNEFKYLYDNLELIKLNEIRSIPTICKIFTYT